MKMPSNKLVDPYRFMYGLILLILMSLSLAVDADGQVYKSQINPQWSADNSHFWYRNDLARGEREFVLVDLKKGTRRPAFDHARLAQLLGEEGVEGVQAERLALEQLKFDLASHRSTFRIQGTYFQYHLKTQKLTRMEKPGDAPGQAKPDPDRSRDQQQPAAKPYQASRDVSADGKWKAYIHQHNVYVQVASEEEPPIQLSTDGKADNGYQSVYWASNSNNLISFRVQPEEVGQVHLIESSPDEGGRAKLETRLV